MQFQPSHVAITNGWASVSFPAAMDSRPPGATDAKLSVPLSWTVEGRFFSAKDVKRIVEHTPADSVKRVLEECEAASHVAWASEVPAFATVVGKDHRNFLGTAFGGNVIDWHIRAAAAAARGALCGARQVPSIRVRGGTVDFLSPLYPGDEVRAYVEPLCVPVCEKLSHRAYVGTYAVRLIARRRGGFSDTSLTVMHVGSSTIEVSHVPAKADHLARYRSLTGFDIGGIIKNDLEVCVPNPVGRLSVGETLLRRYGQLTSAADIRFYLEARARLGGDRVKHPIVTRHLSFEFDPSVGLQGVARHPLRYFIEPNVEMKRVSGNCFLKLHSRVSSGAREVAYFSATMVGLGVVQDNAQ